MGSPSSDALQPARTATAAAHRPAGKAGSARRDTTACRASARPPCPAPARQRRCRRRRPARAPPLHRPPALGTREYEAHAKRGQRVRRRQLPALLHARHRSKADSGNQRAKDDPTAWMYLQLHHQRLRQDQADTNGGKCDAGHACTGRRIQAQAINREEADRDLRDGHRDHRDERCQLRQAQARVETAHRRAALCGRAHHRWCSRQPPGQQCQCQQRQQRGHVQRQRKIGIGQPAGSGRTQYHAQRVGTAQPGEETGALPGRCLVGNQRSGRGRHGRVEQPNQAARAHQHQHRHQYRRHRLQGDVDEHRQCDVDRRIGTHRQHQHALAADAVAELAPGARGQHPQHACGGDRQAGMPLGQAEHADHRADHGDEGHHRHGADQGSQHQRRQAGNDGTCVHGTPAVTGKDGRARLRTRPAPALLRTGRHP